MKKTIILFTIILSTIIQSYSQSYDYSVTVQSGQTLYFKILGGGAWIVAPNGQYNNTVSNPWDGYTKPIGDLVIPSSIYGYTVYSIGQQAFEGCDGLTSITFPTSYPGTWNVKDRLFYGCTNLHSINNYPSNRALGDSFRGCYNLVFSVSYDFGASDSTLFSDIDTLYCGANTLYSPWGAPNVVYTYHVQDGLFFSDSTKTKIIGCADSITNLVIPSTVFSIYDYAFHNNQSLQSVSMTNSVKYLNHNAFQDCNQLSEVTLSDSVSNIGWEAFKGCENMAQINIPNNLQSIEAKSFQGCHSLFNVNIPNTCTTIGQSAFEECYSFDTIVIPRGLNELGDYAFKNDTGTRVVIYNAESLNYGDDFSANYLPYLSLRHQHVFDGIKCKLIVGENVADIHTDLFRALDTNSNNFWTSIDVSPNNPIFDSRDNSNCIIHSATNSIVFGSNISIIPTSIQSIGYKAFSYIKQPFSVMIPDSVTDISSCAFYHCDSLSDMIIGRNVDNIGVSAFRNCPLLDTVTLQCVIPPVLPNNSGITNNVFDSIAIISVPCGTWADYKNTWRNQGHIYQMIVTPVTNKTINVFSNDSSLGSAYVLMQQESVNLFGGATESIEYPIGCDSSVVITADARFGGHFVRWSNGSISNPDTIRLDDDSVIVAFFERNIHSFTLSTNDTTLGILEGQGEYYYGDTVFFVALPNPHCHIETIRSSIFVDSDNTQRYYLWFGEYIRDTMWFVMPNEDIDINVFFYIDRHIVSLNVNDESFGAVSGEGEYDYGSSAILIAAPFEGFHFSHWNNGVTSNPYAITVTHDTTLTAFFSPDGTEGINDKVEWSNIQICLQNSRIVVFGCKKDDFFLYDVAGHLLAIKQVDESHFYIDIPTSGTYFVKVGTSPARKIVVVK